MDETAAGVDAVVAGSASTIPGAATLETADGAATGVALAATDPAGCGESEASFSEVFPIEDKLKREKSDPGDQNQSENRTENLRDR